MLKKILYVLGVTLLLAFSNAQAAKIDAAHVARVKDGAERGDAFAQCILADCYDFADCEGIPHDYTEARKWYEKAATQGKDTAQFNLGLMYYKGKGVPQDYAEARKWYEKAASKDMPMPKSSWAKCMLKAKAFVRTNGLPRNGSARSAIMGTRQAAMNTASSMKLAFSSFSPRHSLT